jgi:hypothetical protein
MAESSLVIGCFAAAVATINVVLTLALVRRVRLLQARVTVPEGGFPAPGRTIGQFSAVDVEGAPVELEQTSGSELNVAFLSPSCAPCRELLQRVTEAPPPAPFVSFVLADDTSASAGMVEALLPLGRVAVIEAEGGAAEAFGITAYPTLVRVRDGVVVASGGSLAAIAG